MELIKMGGPGYEASGTYMYNELSLVPRPLPAFNVARWKLGVAWGRGYVSVYMYVCMYMYCVVAHPHTPYLQFLCSYHLTRELHNYCLTTVGEHKSTQVLIGATFADSANSSLLEHRRAAEVLDTKLGGWNYRVYRHLPQLRLQLNYRCSYSQWVCTVTVTCSCHSLSLLKHFLYSVHAMWKKNCEANLATLEFIMFH